MATSAFKSTTKRLPIGASSADDSANSTRSSAHRRSRSLSRFSHRFASPVTEDSDELAPPRGRFVNTVRGSGFPEISLDDLAVEFFGSDDRGRSTARSSGKGPASGGESAAQRRGRSVSRYGSRLSGVGSDGKEDISGGSGNGPASGGESAALRRERSVSRYGSRLSGGVDGKGSMSGGSGGGGVRLASDNGGHLRSRRRSVSVVRYQISDSESDLDQSQKRTDNPKSFSNGSNQIRTSNKPKASNHRQGLRWSFSQKDLKSCDGYSSHSSVLTDDEVKDARSSKFGNEMTIRAVYAQNKDDVNGSLYEAMRTELRHAVADIRTEFEHARGKTQPPVSATGDCLLSNGSNVIQAVSSIMRNYSTKLEESEKRKQDLLAEIVMEEQRSRELSMIVKELLPDPKDRALDNNKPSQVGPRRRSTDRNRMSKRLSEEAEKYIEDFISNIEDTDISSLDGERSDTSSSLGGVMKTRTAQSPATPLPLSVDMDGVQLPWLKWETSNDTTPVSTMNKSEPPATPKTILFDSAEELTNNAHDRVNLSASSWGSCSPGIIDSLPRHIVQDNRTNDGSKSPGFDMEEYLKLQRDEDLIFERFRQQNRINSGCMLLCNPMFL